MTDPFDTSSTPPGGSFSEEPIPEGNAASGAEGTSARGREWLSQLETMINDIANQAAPVARQVAAKAAELTAVAAVKAGPLAHKAAEATSDAGQKLADRAQNLATELRGAASTAPGEDISWADGGSSPVADTGAPEATFEDATDSTTSTAGATFEDTTSANRDEASGTSF